ncbi:MAG: UDP-glucose 4-epimerase GalE [Bacteroidia bacterium]|nr:UDP-glucose 4-epimerase GalE [Bacteroidia bacterium]
MNEKPLILVTGGTGYIGSHTVIELMQAGYEVVSIDNYSNSSPDRIQRIYDITGQILTNYPVDLCNQDDTRAVFLKHRNIKGIIHFAAFMSVEESVMNPLKYYHNNLESLGNILSLSRQFGVKNIVYSSSCSVYGNVEKLPVTEETPLQKAVSPYANTKLIGEQMIQDFAGSSKGMNFVMLRYFNPVGAHISGKNGEYPGNKPFNLLPIMVEVADGTRRELTVYGTDYDTRDGTCIRDYIHVSDIASAHIQALEYMFEGKNQQKVEIFNLGSGNGVTLREMIHAFEKVNNVALNYTFGDRREGDVAAIYSDSTKAETRLGWKSRYSLRDMVESAWKWQQVLKQKTL